jgi:SAM-dependent methyltransferase
MDTTRRQAAIVLVMTALAGLALVFWVTTSPPPAKQTQPAPAASTPANPPAERDPSAPFEPTVGQDGKDVVWVPTAETLVEAMLDIADVKAGDYLIDLGSGDGRTVIAASKRGVTALGIEFNPDMVALSRERAAAANAQRATFVQGDLFEADLSKATVITMFLLPDINLRLRPRLLELRPGTRIVSNSFDMADWKADQSKTVPVENCKNYCTALFWIVPARVEGTWNLPDGQLELTQTFQQVEGTLAGRPIADAVLRADRLTFAVGSARYQARVTGDSMTGTDRAGRSWTGRRTRRPADAPVAPN